MLRTRIARRTTASLAAGGLLALQVASAAAAPTVIPNGTFEADEPGRTASAVDTEFITGWTVINGLIDLGVTEIAGCTTVDTQDYTQLRDWDEEAEPVFHFVPVPGDPDDRFFTVELPAGTPLSVGGSPLLYDDWNGFYIEDAAAEDGRLYEYQWSEELAAEFAALELAALPDPVERADNVSAAGFFDEIEFSTYLVAMSTQDDGGDLVLVVPDLDTYDVDESFAARSGTALLLYSDLDSDDAGYDGYVAHGPAVYSDVFTIDRSPRNITLSWAALGDSDDFAVLGYLLNVDTCEQIEIIDATGEEAAWTSTSATIEETGDYRFVFVSGTFDKSFGGAAGALFFIDDIAQTAVFTEPGIELELSAEIGATVAGAPVQVSGGGLKPTSPYTLTLRSDPVVLVDGTTDASGNFFNLVDLPAGLTPGTHTLTLVGIAPDDSELTRTVSFTVTAGGTFGSIDEGAPAPSGGSASIVGDGISLSCAPSPLIAGGTATCNVAGGPASSPVLWRVTGPDGQVIASTGVDLDAAGSGTFTFRVPLAFTGRSVDVELVAWLPPLTIAVSTGAVPTRVAAGEGTAPLLPMQLAGLLVAGLAGAAAATRTRRRPTT